MFENGVEEERCYNIRANADCCTLLPEGERNRAVWSVPSAQYTKSYGFGQSMVWYPTEPGAKRYLDRLVDAIENYQGDNWLNTYPEE